MNIFSSFSEVYTNQQAKKNAVVFNYTHQNYGFYGRPSDIAIWLNGDASDDPYPVCSVFTPSNKISSVTVEINPKYNDLVKEAIDELRGSSSSAWRYTILDNTEGTSMKFAVALEKTNGSRLAYELDEKINQLYPTTNVGGY